ncbi:MAG TPA: secretin N-terminal domain-containing protein [Methylomirabilota bacterium]|nr:secretin N-terminal domain-containing protein [Methylomirabilota bacterium]
MKTIHLRYAAARQAAFVLILFLTGLDLWAQTTNAPSAASRLRQLQQRRAMTNNPATMSTAPGAPAAATPLQSPPNFSAPAGPAVPQQPILPMTASGQEKEVPGYSFQYEGVDVNQVLEVYAKLVGRTLLRANISSPPIILTTQSPLTKSEAIQALQAVLALNGISVINISDKFVKVVPTSDAAGAGAALDTTDMADLPDLGSYVTHIVQLNYVKPSVMQPIIAPLAKINSIIPIEDNGILVIRDYAENVKRMLEMIAQVDVSSPQEYTNEVIEIKYALAGDIASALNSLGGTGGATVSIGTSSATTPISGVGNTGQRSGIGGGGSGGSINSGFGSGGATSYGGNQQRFGAQGTTATPNGTASTGSTFQQRLQNIVQNAARSSGGGQQDQIQVFGQAKIIADARANSLLVFATKADMERIKAVVAKLDILLSQVLIESVVMDVTLGHTLNLGVSAAQNPQQLTPHIIGGGGVNNGQPFLTFLKQVSTNGVASIVASGLTNSTFGNNLPGGLSYFGNIGPTWDVAVEAAESDNSANIIQRPRIQTSQAKPATFFVGQTVPYVTGTTFGGSFGNQSSYSQLSVGVELDVTPFINPDGLVVMDINQEVDDLNGTTHIDGVGDIPNTIKRTFSSEIAVKDKDTIMLGGFVRSDRSKTKSGIPLLQDIPILGFLFRQQNTTKDRQETIILMRPTVLKTPEIAAKQALIEEERLPGISAAAAENDKEEAAQVAAERKAEKQRARLRNKENGFFTPAVTVPPPAQVDTNLALPLP